MLIEITYPKENEPVIIFDYNELVMITRDIKNKEIKLHFKNETPEISLLLSMNDFNDQIKQQLKQYKDIEFTDKFKKVINS